MSQIEKILAREVYDSRGKPTVEVEVRCVEARAGRAIVPSGASTGRFEAHELRDGDPQRLQGAGVLNAVRHVNDEIAPVLIGLNAADQRAIDKTLCDLDGSANKSRLGANAILGVSLAVAHAAAEAAEISLVEHFQRLWREFDSEKNSTGDTRRTALIGSRPLLPLPMVNMISGGLHAGGNLDFQDYLILPVGANSYRQALEWVVTVYHKLGRQLIDGGYEGRLVGDEGGYGPNLESNQQALDFVMRSIEACNLRPGTDISIGLDVASTHFFDGTNYRLAATGGESLSANDVIDLLEQWVDKYPIISIEDGLAEEDWEGWQKLTERLGHRVQLIGDDLFVTNHERLKQGIESGVGNSVLVKLNQIGTLSETLDTFRLALDHDYWPVVSARSGETEDVTISDLAVACGAGQIKIGSIARSERLVKYNQLLRLEERLGADAFLGGKIFNCLEINNNY